MKVESIKEHEKSNARVNVVRSSTVSAELISLTTVQGLATMTELTATKIFFKLFMTWLSDQDLSQTLCGSVSKYFK